MTNADRVLTVIAPLRGSGRGDPGILHGIVGSQARGTLPTHQRFIAPSRGLAIHITAGWTSRTGVPLTVEALR